MKTTIRFEGGDRLAKALGELSTRVSKNVLRESLRTAVAEPMRSLASTLAPRAPGAPDIAGHIAISVARGDRSEVVAAGSNVTLAVGPSTEKRDETGRQKPISYALQGKYLEFGTARTKMQAFLRPAFDQLVPRVIPEIGAAMWHALIRRGVGGTRGSLSGGGLT